MKQLLIILLQLVIYSAYSLEPHFKGADYAKEGFSLVDMVRIKNSKSLIYKNNLDWPFEAPYKKGFIGNNFVQIQPYTFPGYHGGSDMILEKDSWIKAPISGKIEAGHYDYKDNQNGSSVKLWKPWPAEGEAAFFEVAVIDKSGNRFEFHHIEKTSLPQNIIDLLSSKNPTVKAGEKLGRVFNWTHTKFHYHHIHVNVINSNGEYINPESVFRVIPDTIPPEVKVLVENSSKDTKWFTNGDFITKDARAFIIDGFDKKNNNHFTQPPVKVALTFKNGIQKSWNFKQKLKDDLDKFADIRKVYPEQIRLPNGTIKKQQMPFYPVDNSFLIRLEIPRKPGLKKFTLEIEDQAGNKTQLKGQME